MVMDIPWYVFVGIGLGLAALLILRKATRGDQAKLSRTIGIIAIAIFLIILASYFARS